MPALHEAVPSLSTTAARVYALMRNLNPARASVLGLASRDCGRVRNDS